MFLGDKIADDETFAFYGFEDDARLTVQPILEARFVMNRVLEVRLLPPVGPSDRPAPLIGCCRRGTSRSRKTRCQQSSKTEVSSHCTVSPKPHGMAAL